MSGDKRDVDSGSSVKVTYWAAQVGNHTLSDLEGIDSFRDDLANEYISVIHPRPGGLGGLLQFAVEFVSGISMADVAKFLAGGMVYASSPAPMLLSFDPSSKPTAS